MNTAPNKYDNIKPGDKVKVERKVIEGDKERIQVIEGTVIARKHGKEVSATITVRKIANGIGVEFVFPLNSPRIKAIKILKKSKVRRAKLYYLRERTGRATRMKEDRVATLAHQKEEEAKKSAAKAKKEAEAKAKKEAEAKAKQEAEAKAKAEAEAEAKKAETKEAETKKAEEKTAEVKAEAKAEPKKEEKAEKEAKEKKK